MTSERHIPELVSSKCMPTALPSESMIRYVYKTVRFRGVLHRISHYDLSHGLLFLKSIRSMVENDRLSTLRTDFQSLPLQDIMFYNLDDAESAFFKSQTGIQDDELLKKHIVEAQEEAFKVLAVSFIN